MKKPTKAAKLRPLISSLFAVLCLFKTAFGEAFFVRDSETEDYIKSIVTAIAPEKKIDIYLLKDDSINAFVYGGSKIFVHTGLIQSSDTYEMLQGVLAHEVGHIHGAHLLKFSRDSKDILAESAFYTLATMALIVVAGGGGPDALIAGTLAGSNVAEKRVLSYSRAQEREADIYAINALKRVKSSGRGFLDLFIKIGRLETRFTNRTNVDTYAMTHPLSSQREEFVRANFKELSYTPFFDEVLQRRHLFILAKMAGYFDNLNSNFSRVFFEDNQALAYYKAVSAFRNGRYEEAISLIQGLSSAFPKNPYFFELLGEVYFKTGAFRKSIAAYKKALEQNPKDFNFLIGLAGSYSGEKKHFDAIKTYNQAWEVEPENYLPPYKISMAYGALEKPDLAMLYLLEFYIATKKLPQAKQLLGRLRASERPNFNAFFDKKMNDIADVLNAK